MSGGEERPRGEKNELKQQVVIDREIARGSRGRSDGPRDWWWWFLSLWGVLLILIRLIEMENKKSQHGKSKCQPFINNMLDVNKNLSLFCEFVNS